MLRRRIDPKLRARIDAEDILSEALIDAKRRWSKYCAAPSVPPYAWLYQIAIDCLGEAWRKHTREKRDHRRDVPFPDQSSVQLGMKLVSQGRTPSSLAASDEHRKLIRSLLEQLDEPSKQMLWMKYFDELTFNEIGSVLQITSAAAAQRCGRALRKLTQQWNRIRMR